MAQDKKKSGGNGVLIFLGILILAAMIAVILGFCTNWYRDWTRFGIGGEQQEEQLPDETPDGEEGEQQTPDDGQEEQLPDETPDDGQEEQLPDETPDGEEGEQQTPDDGQEPEDEAAGNAVGSE